LVSADSETVDGLVEAELVRPSDRRRMMSNRLVVIVPKESGRHIEAPADLKAISRIAIGDPTIVPAGIYAQKWLETAGVWKDLQDRIVPTLDVRAALTAVESGHAEAGVVYRTDAAASSHARIAYEVPAESGPPITYVAARLARSPHPSAALFLDFLVGPQARATFSRYGFVL
jgi:molybdate transport system substrate-binding protein